MPLSSKLFTAEQENLITEAIGQAENNTSGEIRVHIEQLCIGQDALQRARKLFVKLKMTETQLKNGVLIYISTVDHKLAIFGDSGIHEKVGQEFWDEDIEILKSHFKKGNYAEGLTQVIARIGEKLKEFFPYSDDDTNELSNEISYG